MVRFRLPLVGASGLEPPTPTLSGWCSNLLSYAPIMGSIKFLALTQLLFTAPTLRGDA